MPEELRESRNCWSWNVEFRYRLQTKADIESYYFRHPPLNYLIHWTVKPLFLFFELSYCFAIRNAGFVSWESALTISSGPLAFPISFLILYLLLLFATDTIYMKFFLLPSPLTNSPIICSLFFFSSLIWF